MTQYNVTGMSCAACSCPGRKGSDRRVPGVTSCSVSLLTNSMGVEGTAAPQAIIAAVQAAGYGASLKGRGQSRAERCRGGSRAGGSRNAEAEAPAASGRSASCSC